MSILVYILYSLVLVISLVLFFNVFKINSQEEQEIQILDIITCKDGVKFKIIDIKEISYSYGFKRIELILLTDKKRKIPTYTISEESLDQFIIFRYGCRDESGCVRYSHDTTTLSSIGNYELDFDYMREYEIDIILNLFKDKYSLSDEVVKKMRNMSNHEFDMAYEDLVFNLKGK